MVSVCVGVVVAGFNVSVLQFVVVVISCIFGVVMVANRCCVCLVLVVHMLWLYVVVSVCCLLLVVD